ncbi:MAG: MarR family transcriptional regulator, partial [Nonlabens ulvanivorans]
MKDSEMPIARRLVTTLIKKGTEMTESVSEIVKKEGLTIQQFNVLRILRGRKGKAANLQDVSRKM